MPFIPFPDVPNYPGVPTLNTQAGIPLNLFVPLLTGDDPAISSLVAPAVWGLFDGSGNPVVLADSVISFEHTKEYRTCEYPVEPGSTDNFSGSFTPSSSFETYNKVEMPYDVRISFAKGGTDGDRSSFLSSIDAIAGDTNLYTINTPDFTLGNANVVRYDYRRTAQNGVTLLVVEVYIRQIRVTNGSTQFTQTNTADPASADAQSGGQVNPVLPDTSESSVIDNGAS